MWSLSIASVSLLVCYCSAFSGAGDLMRFMNDCKYPESVEGKFCAALLDNDIDGDGFTTDQDFSHDGILYSSIDGDVCKQESWETLYWWTCRYGWTEGYARFFMKSFEPNGVENYNFGNYVTGRPIKIPNSVFLDMQYDRYLAYCNSTLFEDTPLDREQCADARALSRQDIKC